MTDVIFLPLTRAWGAEGCDEAGWGEAESQPEAGECVLQCPAEHSAQHVHVLNFV